MKGKILVITSAIILATLSLAIPSISLNKNKAPVEVECKCSGVVDKAPGEAFTVEITFKNTGQAVGSWSVNIAFEGEEWSWSGTPQNLTLRPCHKKTLTWNGNVPEDAPVNSIARLVVYFNGDFAPLDWWIRVVDAAELTIVSSNVE